MSRARSGVLAVLESSAGPTSLSELAEVTGLHVNTLREHLAALTEAGLVEREAGLPSGRGRPAALYRSAVQEGSPFAEYAGLASTLAAAIHRTSDDPSADAVAAGVQWGRELARSAGHPSEAGDVPARRQVVDVLDRMGFDPRVDTASGPDITTVRLTRCPLLDTARKFPDVVCGVHLGIARGALREYDADDTGSSLVPFAEPGACLLHLGSRSTDDHDRTITRETRHD